MKWAWFNSNRATSHIKSFLIYLFLCLISFFACESTQPRETEGKNKKRISVVPFQNRTNTKDKVFGNVLTSAVISSLSFSEKTRYVDDEFEKFYIFNAMQLAQTIGDSAFEKFLKDIVDIHGKENPGIDIYISGYFYQKENKTVIELKFLYENGDLSEFQIESENSIELIQSLSLRVLAVLEPENKNALQNLETGFLLTKDFEALNLYLEGKEEKRKKTIYGYINAIRKFQKSQERDGLYLLPLNEIIHTLTQISTDLFDLTKQEKIINDSKLISDAKIQLKRNGDILQNAIGIYNEAKKNRPEEYERIYSIYEKSPYKKQYELKSSLFKNQMEMLLLRWEDDKFQRESLVRGQIKRINSGYTPLLVTEFFQTLTDSKININDILRSLLKYSQDHPQNRYYIHYFKNFTRLIKTMSEFDYMRLNPEANFSYHQLHQEYIHYVKEYLKVMREGL